MTFFKLLITTLSALLICFSFILDYQGFRNQDTIMNRFQCLLYDKNSISVTTNELDFRKVSIVNMEKKDVVYEQGMKVSRIENQYGDTDFQIFYDDTLIGQAGVFKTNWWHTNDYYFQIFKTPKGIAFEFKVNGPDKGTCYYKYYIEDVLEKKSTEVFYDENGTTGQINISYVFDQSKLTVTELWINKDLESLFIDSNGIWNKSYSRNNTSSNEVCLLYKIENSDSLIYTHRSIKNKKITDERIAIKREYQSKRN